MSDLKHAKQERKLAAILFADIVGYTALMQRGEGKAMSILNRFQEVTATKVKEHKGEIIKTYGDGSLILFDSTVDAVNCAHDMQLDFKQGTVVPLRIGIHVGEVVRKDNDVFGNGVNIASRVESMGETGAVLMSADVQKRVKNQETFKTQSLGYFEFKNVEEPMEVFALANEGFAIPKSDEISGKFKKNSSISEQSMLQKWWPLITFLFIASAVYFFINQSNGGPREEITLNEKSIAVLPFVDLSENKDQEWFSDGMMEEILNSLVQIADLSVTSRTSAMQFKGSKKSIREIGQDLGVANILEGSVRRQGDRLRITVQLIDVVTDKHLWSQNYDRTVTDVFAIQSEVSQHIASSLQAKVSPEVKLRIEKQPTSNPVAYDLYLQALSHARTFSENGFSEAEKLWEKAVQVDPNFADAYVQLGWVRSRFAWNGTAIVNSAQEAFEKSNPYLQKAIEIDSNNQLAHLYKAWTLLWYKWDFEAAEKEYQILVKLYPNFTWADFLIASGRFKEAAERAEKAVEIDPLHGGNWSDKILSYYFNGQYDKSLEAINSIKESNFHSTILATSIARVFLYMGMYEEVLVEMDLFDENFADYKDAPRIMCIKAIANHQLGEIEKAEMLLNNLKERYSKTSAGSPAFHLAMIYAHKEEVDTAFEWLNKAYEDHEVEMHTLKTEPLFRPLYRDPRWEKVLDKIGFPKKLKN